jgi:hypothetical protein
MTGYNLSITTFGHKSWSERDRAQLMIAYKMGAGLKTISRIVKRSVTATNKAISRFGFRAYYGTRRDMLPNTVRAAPTYEQIMAAIEAYEATHMIDTAEETTKQAKTSKENMTIPVIENPTLSHQEFKKTDLCVKFSTVLQECRKTGLNFKPLYNSHLNAQGYYYLLNNRPARSFQLLLEVNANRRAQGLPIYHVKGITCE